MPFTSPRLWIVATPIGNAGDFSPRAREILANADLILAEDTRRAGRMLAEYGIKPEKLLSFFDHNEDKRQEQALAILRQGGTAALMSDAGTPLLADPGYRLVRACRKENIPVSPAPGPFAAAAALSAAGIPPIPHTFLGFLPRAEKNIKDIFSAFAASPGSLIFFERKDRLSESLAIALSILGKRELAICRELTKTHEEFILGELENYQDLCENLLGEITVIIGPPADSPKSSPEEAEDILRRELEKWQKPRKAAIAARRKCRGWTVKELYELASGINSGKQ